MKLARESAPKSVVYAHSERTIELGNRIINLFVIVAGGVMLADMIANAQGTTAFFNGIGSLWKISVNGMLGKSS